jgi:hypothetical protein
MGILMRLLKLFDVKHYDERITSMKQQRKKQDEHIKQLTNATLNGDDEWMVRVVRRNPECALKIMTDCNGEKHAQNR